MPITIVKPIVEIPGLRNAQKNEATRGLGSPEAPVWQALSPLPKRTRTLGCCSPDFTTIIFTPPTDPIWPDEQGQAMSRFSKS